MQIEIFNHISLGQVWNVKQRGTKMYCRTVSDNIQYKINLIDLIDY